MDRHLAKRGRKKQYVLNDRFNIRLTAFLHAVPTCPTYQNGTVNAPIFVLHTALKKVQVEKLILG
jgi:hypothetical protein